MPIEIKRCRVCASERLDHVLDLGVQYLTGVFPRTQVHSELSKGPLRLVRCARESGCGLVQLAHSYDATDMYGENYGYRSGLNPSMVRHLESRVRAITQSKAINPGDVVIDIGSNDGTTLGFYPESCVRIGIDPTAKKFESYYPPNIITRCDFFSKETALAASHGRKAAVITAFSMLYDLDDPVSFVQQVADVLDADGIFVFEQSYMPLMLERVSFDTICHEHIEYYGLRQIEWILNAAGLEAIDVELNDVNGGSFAVTAAHCGRYPAKNAVSVLRAREQPLWSHISERLDGFSKAVEKALQELNQLIRSELNNGKTFGALGASTKGNVLLQAAQLGPNEISLVGDINPDKHGRFTPGTGIPIVSEHDALSARCDYYIVLPWHFRDFFERAPHLAGKRLVFPLPKLEIVSPGQ